ncbi:hypothetical protein B0E51_11425 [Rhodanobacter sp. C05]|nr:hypothetical protein B0E51_11425 [Rhodanobacter sp. C05]
MLLLFVALLGPSPNTSAAGTDPRPFKPPQLRQDSTLEQLALGYQQERSDAREGPKLGIALSGGGTRAAYFALGVLAGLNDSGTVNHLDAISSVSGGGYTALWYYSKRYVASQQGWDYHTIFADCFPAWLAPNPGNQGEVDKTKWLIYRAAVSQGANDPGGANRSQRRLKNTCDKYNTVHYERPDDPYLWQAYLARWPNLMSGRPLTITGDRQPDYTMFTANYIEKMIKAELQGKNASGGWYEEGIKRVWWEAPEPRQYPTDRAAYAKARALESVPIDWSPRPGPRLNSFDDLEVFTRADATVPFWIINTNSGQTATDPNFSHVFEITPYAYGSGEANYATGHLPGVDLIKATKLSGAFLDPQNATVFSGLNIGATLGKWLTLGDLDWGEDVTTPGLKQRSHGRKYHLSDGGGEENLGLYSLVRRGVPNIIVVDGEEDVQGQLTALCRNWAALNAMGWKLEIDHLESLQDTCDKEAHHNFRNGYNTSAWLNPVMVGEIYPTRDEPTTSENAEDRLRNTVHLVYIKLGWDENAYRDSLNHQDCETANDDRSCFLTIYYGENACNHNDVDKWMLFPQMTTVGLTTHATTYQFWAFRELGREAGRLVKWDPNTSQFTIPEERLQPRLRAFSKKEMNRPQVNPRAVGSTCVRGVMKAA